MIRIEVTLSRTHKIAERLKTQAAEYFKEALALGALDHVAGITGDAHVQRLGQKGTQAMELTQKGVRFMRVHAAVRGVIGRENQTRGINELLARLDSVNKLVAHYKAMLELAKADGIEPAELSTYKPLNGAEARYSAGIAVNVLGLEHRAELEKELAVLQREAFQLADQIAEANAGRVSLDLNEDIAQAVTGA